MNLSTFWKKPKLSTVDIHLKSGSVIRLDHLTRFKVTSNTSTGEITCLEWEFAPGKTQSILYIRLDDISLVTEFFV
jgi:hypothetical protein